jgi:hypothetical protein
MISFNFQEVYFTEDNLILDDVFEKKHMNLKNLMVQKEKEGGYVEKKDRGIIVKWKGLPKNAFQIDFTSRPEFAEIKSKKESHWFNKLC